MARWDTLKNIFNCIFRKNDAVGGGQSEFLKTPRCKCIGVHTVTSDFDFIRAVANETGAFFFLINGMYSHVSVCMFTHTCGF